MAADCEFCDESFDSERERLEHELAAHDDELTSHARDEKERKLSKLRDDQTAPSFFERHDPKRVIVITGIVLLLAVGSVYAYQQGFIEFNASQPTTDPQKGIGTPVHWHADYQITVCGERQVLQGGPKLAHTHGEQTFHLEGTRTSHEQTTLKWVVNQLGADFSNNGILGHTEPESCPGSDEPGNLSVTANGDELDNPANYTIQDGDKIRITYE